MFVSFSLSLVRRTLKGGIVDEEGNNLQMVLADHASNTKEQTDSTPPPKHSPYRRSSSRQEQSPVTNQAAVTYQSPVAKQSPVSSRQANGHTNSYYEKPTRGRGSVTSRYKHIAT